MAHKHTRAASRKETTAGETAPPPSSPRQKRSRTRAEPPPVAALLVARLNEIEQLLADIWAEPKDREQRIVEVHGLLEEVRGMVDRRLLPPLLSFRLTSLEAAFQETADIADLECKDLDVQRAELAIVERHLADAHGSLVMAFECWANDAPRARLDVQRASTARALARAVLAHSPEHDAFWLRRARSSDFAVHIEDDIRRLTEWLAEPAPVAPKTDGEKLIEAMIGVEIHARRIETDPSRGHDVAREDVQLAAYVSHALLLARKLHARAAAGEGRLQAVLEPDTDRSPILALYPPDGELTPGAEHTVDEAAAAGELAALDAALREAHVVVAWSIDALPSRMAVGRAKVALQRARAILTHLHTKPIANDGVLPVAGSDRYQCQLHLATLLEMELVRLDRMAPLDETEEPSDE